MASVIVPAGRNWLLADRESWPALAKDYKSRGLKSWTQKLTVENRDTDEVFIVAEFRSPTTLPAGVVKRFGPVLSVDDEDPMLRGLWEQPDPSAEHYVYETGDAVEELADRAASAVGSLTGALWALAAAAGAYLLIRRK